MCGLVHRAAVKEGTPRSADLIRMDVAFFIGVVLLGATTAPLTFLERQDPSAPSDVRTSWCAICTWVGADRCGVRVGSCNSDCEDWDESEKSGLHIGWEIYRIRETGWSVVRNDIDRGLSPWSLSGLVCDWWEVESVKRPERELIYIFELEVVKITISFLLYTYCGTYYIVSLFNLEPRAPLQPRYRTY